MREARILENDGHIGTLIIEYGEGTPDGKTRTRTAQHAARNRTPTGTHRVLRPFSHTGNTEILRKRAGPAGIQGMAGTTEKNE